MEELYQMILVDDKTKGVGIVGSGPTALFIALELVSKNINVTMFEKTTSPSRKLLLASQSGLNLTTETEGFVLEYSTPVFTNLIDNFNQEQLIKWIEALGLHIFRGNGNKIFLKETGEELIRTCFEKLRESKLFKLKLEHNLKDWKNHQLIFSTHKNQNTNTSQTTYGNQTIDESQTTYSFEKIIFCLGGASWPLTGSDGEWISLFRDKGISCVDFEPSNCRFKREWSTQCQFNFIPVKNIMLKRNNKNKRGDLMLTPDGVEGAPLYYFSRELRDSLSHSGNSAVEIDLLPDRTEKELCLAWNSARKSDSITNKLRKTFKLDKTKIALFNELCTRPIPHEPEEIVKQLRNLKLEFIGIADISEAISSSGGVDISELNSNLELKKRTDCYCGGEMVNWDAPTGGYLIHGCLAMGRRISNSILSFSQS